MSEFEYVLIKHRTHFEEEFIQEVNDTLARGGELVGGPFHYANGGGLWIAQALVVKKGSK